MVSKILLSFDSFKNLLLLSSFKNWFSRFQRFIFETSLKKKRNAWLYTLIPLLSHLCLLGQIILLKKMGSTTLSPLSLILLVQVDKSGIEVGWECTTKHFSKKKRNAWLYTLIPLLSIGPSRQEWDRSGMKVYNQAFLLIYCQVWLIVQTQNNMLSSWNVQLAIKLYMFVLGDLSFVGELLLHPPHWPNYFLFISLNLKP
jgi:hypothetical protein